MNRNRIKLLVTLVLFILAGTSTWMASQADARGPQGPGASSHLSATRPGAGLAAGEPDGGSGGITPPPPPTLKQMRQQREGGGGSGDVATWFRWTGRIWATLYLKALR
jgi:hypothetical protein